MREIPEAFLNMVRKDIQRIDETVCLHDTSKQWELFRELDGKYQACIREWYRGMWQSTRDGTQLYFNVLKEHPNQVTDNLRLIKSKLKTYQFQMNAAETPDAPSTQVNVTTTVNMNITFEQIRAKIEDMTSLTDEQTKEALEKVSEIESVIKGEGSKKSKWEKIKPVLAWLADKSFDLAMTILPLLLQVQG